VKYTPLPKNPESKDERAANYALPYASLHAEPAIIISFVAPGNIYPTCEQHKGPASLAGKPLRTPGYNAHYVLTKKDGFAVTQKGESPMYDELVVPEESQVAPAFIILSKIQCLPKLLKSILKFEGMMNSLEIDALRWTKIE